MTVSPIKTILRNVSGNRYSFNLGMDKRITLLPAGGPCDTVVIPGDVFSQFREGKESDGLVYGVIRNDIVISYVVESSFEVTRSDNCLQASTANLTAIYRSWADQRKGVDNEVEATKEPVAPVVEKKKEEPLVTATVEEPKVDEVTIEPVVTDEPKEPKVEPSPVTEEVAEVEKQTEEEKEPEEAPAVKKRNRRVKLG